MTREEAAEAVLAGARVAEQLASEGVRVIGTGEMGIGNTTAASALAAAYTNVPVNRVIGRGTGVDDRTLALKTTLVHQALLMHKPDREDPLGTLAALGGLEIAAMAGVIIGGAGAGVCVITDGFISASAALAAVALCPACLPYVFASHLSCEPGHHVALVSLGLEPYLSLDMRLGEGTGAALGIGIMGAACAMMNGMATFAEAGVSDRDEA
jgi:nicotinate-nucleotide--dimethylbenzimidazole phosphoribosyltransferase